MNFNRFNLWLKQLAALIALIVIFLPQLALANARDDFQDLLESRQRMVTDAFDRLDVRVKGMNSRDPKKEEALDLLDTAEDKVDAFTELSAAGHILPRDGDDSPFEPDQEFLSAERQVTWAMNAVNQHLFAPSRPAAVPQGDLVEDFIPQFIRQLFRFASVAILIAIIVSAIFFITSFDNEEQQTKARKMLIYALLGFLFVALAFALVKAITDIDFFNFV